MGSQLIVDPETQANRDATMDLIQSRPVSIAIIRKNDFTRSPSGGQVRTDPETTLIEKARYFGGIGGNPFVIESSNGERHAATYVLVGRWDDDIRKYDEFVVGDQRYMVAGVDDATRSYQTKAWVVQK